MYFRISSFLPATNFPFRCLQSLIHFPRFLRNKFMQRINIRHQHITQHCVSAEKASITFQPLQNSSRLCTQKLRLSRKCKPTRPLCIVHKMNYADVCIDLTEQKQTYNRHIGFVIYWLGQTYTTYVGAYRFYLLAGYRTHSCNGQDCICASQKWIRNLRRLLVSCLGLRGLFYSVITKIYLTPTQDFYSDFYGNLNYVKVNMIKKPIESKRSSNIRLLDTEPD